MLVYQRIRWSKSGTQWSERFSCVKWNGAQNSWQQRWQEPVSARCRAVGILLWAALSTGPLHPKWRESRQTDVQEDWAGPRRNFSAASIVLCWFMMIYVDLDPPVIVDYITSPQVCVTILCNFPRFPWQFFAGHFAIAWRPCTRPCRPKMVWTSSSTSGTILRIPPSADGGVDLVYYLFVARHNKGASQIALIYLIFTWYFYIFIQSIDWSQF